MVVHVRLEGAPLVHPVNANGAGDVSSAALNSGQERRQPVGHVEQPMVPKNKAFFLCQFMCQITLQTLFRARPGLVGSRGEREPSSRPPIAATSGPSAGSCCRQSRGRRRSDRKYGSHPFLDFLNHSHI